MRRVLTGALTPKGLRDAWFVAASYVVREGVPTRRDVLPARALAASVAAPTGGVRHQAMLSVLLATTHRVVCLCHLCCAQANCGDAAVDGDGVTPLACASLPGAASLVLPGVWHNAAPGKRWYGSDEVVEQWGALLP